jgi:hypothetical protein
MWIGYFKVIVKYRLVARKCILGIQMGLTVLLFKSRNVGQSMKHLMSLVWDKRFPQLPTQFPWRGFYIIQFGVDVVGAAAHYRAQTTSVHLPTLQISDQTGHY